MDSRGGGAGGMAATIDISTACARARAAVADETVPAAPALLIAMYAGAVAPAAGGGATLPREVCRRRPAAHPCSRTHTSNADSDRSRRADGRSTFRARDR